ncbi:MAG: 50S ribosomal protein L27 [Kosmotogaceae bacterium]|jgi:large subunit ribosomal protein L27
MAHKKSGGVARNGRDSNAKYRGIKRGENSFVKSGTIILKQCGTKIHPGENVGMGRDFTLYALIDGKVHFETKRNRKFVSVYNNTQQ